METHPNLQDKENPSPHASSPNCSTSSSGSSGAQAAAAAQPPIPPPLTPRSSIPRPPTESNPYPTTFVQADTSSFKQVVQMLTGCAETTAKHAAAGASASNQTPSSAKSSVPPASKATAPKRPAFKLYERRSSMRNLKVISPLVPAFLSSASSNPNSPVGFSPRNKQPEILSPSMLDLPSLVLSPVTPLIPDPFNRPPQPGSAHAVSAEERAIAEKGFYLHPSPRTTPRDGEPPRLLPLFPVTSPGLSNASTSP